MALKTVAAAAAAAVAAAAATVTATCMPSEVFEYSVELYISARGFKGGLLGFTALTKSLEQRQQQQ